MTTKNNKVYSDKQEKLVASYLGWNLVTGSGARPNHPGDVISDEWLGECKTHTTEGHDIYFNFEVFQKIIDEASSQFKKAVLFTDDGSQKANHTWCIAPIEAFSLDIDSLKQHEYVDILDYINKAAFTKSRSWIEAASTNSIIILEYSEGKYASLLSLEEFKNLIG